MKRIVTTAVATALLALVLASAAGASVPNGMGNWENMDAGLQPRTTWISNQAFRLKNVYNNQLLGYGNQTFGPDLQWGDHGDWIVTLAPGSGARTRPITDADHIALFNTMAGRYLVYNQNNTGVDLGWSSSPSFQWQIAGSGKNRGLYNTVERDYLNYGNQTFGIDLIWSSHEFGGNGYRPPDYTAAPSGPQVSYVTLQKLATPGLMKETYRGTLRYQTYHTAVVDQIQNTSQYPITFTGWEYPAPNACRGLQMRQGAMLNNPQLAAMTQDESGPRQSYDIRSCGALPGTDNGSAPLVRVTYHYVS